MKEIWEYIPDTDKKYQVSTLGRIKRNNKIVKPFITSRGYYSVIMDRKINCVHRLVAMTFKPIANQENLVVNHIDGNKLNNSLINLEWCTQKYNILHSKVLGRHYIFSDSDRERALPNRLNKVRKKVLCLETEEIFESITAAAKAKKVYVQNICKCCSNKHKTTGGFHWEYVA